MRTAKCFGIASGSAGFLVTVRRRFVGNLGRIVALLLLVTAACGSAKAQYLGYAANSTDGTVSVFAVATSTSVIFGNVQQPGNQDHTIATVPVGKNPVRIAVTPSPNLNRAYVTNQGDNSLWVIDVTNVSQEAISLGSITRQNINASNQLLLNQPGGIAIVSVNKSGAANNGKVLAFVANQGNNKVSIIDTSNNTLFGTVTLGSAGASTTLPEVAATPDGQVFVTNNFAANCVPPPNAACPVWMIDATSVTNGSSATPIPVSFSPPGCISACPPPISLVQPRGISATQFTDTTGQRHTLVFIADFGTGNIFVLDRVVGKTISTIAELLQFPGTVTATPVEVLPYTYGGGVFNAEVVDAAGPFWQLGGINCSTGCANTGTPTLRSSTVNGFTPTSLAITPDASFTYVTYSPAGYPFQLIQNLNLGANGISYCFTDSSTCANLGSVNFGNGAVGLTISKLDKDSPPVVWFIPSKSGGVDIPAVVPHDKIQSALGESIVGAGQAITTTLSFGGNNGCTLFPNPAPPAGVAGTCTHSNSGTDEIGGTTTFPASGVFTIQIEEDSTNSQGGQTQAFAKAVVNIGANCTLGVTPITVLIGQSVNASLTCTAPGTDMLLGNNMNWGDGSLVGDVTPVVNANGGTPVTLNFPSHKYSANGVFSVSASVDDIFGANFVVGSVTPAFIRVAVGLACILSASPTKVATAVTVTATLNCAAPATHSLSGAVDWGDGTKSPSGSATADSSGSATLSFTHSYANLSNPTFPISATNVTDTTQGLPAVVSPSSVAITVANTPPVIAPPTSQSSTTIGPGQSATVPVNFTGGSAGITFTTITCAVSPAGGPNCSVSPSTLTLDANGNGAVQVTVTSGGTVISLAVPQSGRQRAPLFATLIALPGIGIVFLGIGISRSRTRQRLPRGLFLLLLTSLILLSTGACTNVQRSNVACSTCATAGAYTVTVTATSLQPPLQAKGIFTVTVAH